MTWVNSDLSKAARDRLNAIAVASGHPLDQDLPVETAQKLFDPDALIKPRAPAWGTPCTIMSTRCSARQAARQR